MNTNEENKNLSDAEILNILFDEIRYNANSFANKLGYSSSSSIYHILKGQNQISKQMADKIVDIFPNVNYLFLTKGELPVLIEDSINDKEIRQSNQDFASFDEIPKTLKNIERLLMEISKKISCIILFFTF